MKREHRLPRGKFAKNSRATSGLKKKERKRNDDKHPEHFYEASSFINFTRNAVKMEYFRKFSKINSREFSFFFVEISARGFEQVSKEHLFISLNYKQKFRYKEEITAWIQFTPESELKFEGKFARFPFYELWFPKLSKQMLPTFLPLRVFLFSDKPRCC